MRYLLLNLFVPGMILAVSVGALAQGTTYKLGRTPSEAEIRAWDISVSPTGKGLPPGSGTAAQGAIIYAQKCVKCHGPTGQTNNYGYGSPTGSILVRRTGGPDSPPSPPTWALATEIWDHINKAMPRFEEGTLTAHEVYALTAHILFWNGIIKATDVMDAQSLPKVKMPRGNQYVPAPPNWSLSVKPD